jgi:hypothetical protein
MKLAVLLAALLIVGGCLVLVACFRRERDWSQAKSATAVLDQLLEVTLPEDLRYDARLLEQTPDMVQFTFQRVNDTHLNGMTSYAEALRIQVVAPDCPAETWERILKDWSPFRGRQGPPEIQNEGKVKWESRAGVYERDPVREPSWTLRLIDPEARLVLTWWGYQKQYTLEQARANLSYARGRMVLKQDVLAYLRPHRPWAVESAEATFQANLAALRGALVELGFPPLAQSGWTRHGEWRYLIDQERPRQFQLVRMLGRTPKPDVPVILHGAITQARFQQGRWVQNTQVPGAVEVPAATLPGLTAEFSGPDQVYFYFARAVNLWEAVPGSGLTARLRALVAEGGEMDAAFRAGRMFQVGRDE